MKIWITLGILFLAITASAANERPQNLTPNKERPYAGGKDEQDLVVQTKMVPPTVTLDRSSIEQKVLKSNFKKDEAGRYKKQ